MIRLSDECNVGSRKRNPETSLSGHEGLTSAAAAVTAVNNAPVPMLVYFRLTRLSTQHKTVLYFNKVSQLL
jgi:hypothetical protein